MAPRRGHFRYLAISPLVPVVTPDHDVAVAIVAAITVVPAAMHATVVPVELDARTAVVAVAVVTSIAAYIDAKPLRASGRGDTDGESCQCGERIGKLLHCSSPLVATREETDATLLCCRELQETFLNRCSPPWQASFRVPIAPQVSLESRQVPVRPRCRSGCRL